MSNPDIFRQIELSGAHVSPFTAEFHVANVVRRSLRESQVTEAIIASDETPDLVKDGKGDDGITASQEVNVSGDLEKGEELDLATVIAGLREASAGVISSISDPM